MKGEMHALLKVKVIIRVLRDISLIIQLEKEDISVITYINIIRLSTKYDMFPPQVLQMKYSYVCIRSVCN